MTENTELCAMLAEMDERTKIRFLAEYQNKKERYSLSFVNACYTVYQRSHSLGISGPIRYYDVLGESVKMLCAAN